MGEEAEPLGEAGPEAPGGPQGAGRAGWGGEARRPQAEELQAKIAQREVRSFQMNKVCNSRAGGKALGAGLGKPERPWETLMPNLSAGLRPYTRKRRTPRATGQAMG